MSSGRPNPAAHLPRSPPSSLFTRPSDRARRSPPNPVAVPVGEGIRATSPRRLEPSPPLTRSPSRPLRLSPLSSTSFPTATERRRRHGCAIAAATEPRSPPRRVHELRRVEPVLLDHGPEPREPCIDPAPSSSSSDPRRRSPSVPTAPRLPRARSKRLRPAVSSCSSSPSPLAR